MEDEINKTYEQIENKILNHEIYQNVKDYSRKLTNRFGSKYSSSLLYKIKQFYNIIEKVPYNNIEDLISKLKINGTTTFCESMELTKARKEKYGREKDLLDAKFIDSHKIDIEKYQRVKKVLELSTISIKSFEEIAKASTIKIETIISLFLLTKKFYFL